ncbi:peptide chain release factor N(5)-glutamine methyltransferase [Pseudidiomarina sp.]|uniref:peptide chain release factor N(5)-glutamine methyltransferase n=1 Tax=Pseudidiomarina sp. TaxID=2081707 RepID=UPI0039A6CF3D
MPAVTIAEAVLQAAARLAASDTPRLDAELLLAHSLQKTRTYLLTWPERALTAAQYADFNELVTRRAQGEPVAHLTGHREFWSLPLLVNDSTLIPRPDTEVLVEQALALNLPEHARVLDLGTGTGAIALALKSERPGWVVEATDQSAAAVALAQANARQLELSVRVWQSSWFDAVVDINSYDLIVSNPPYIAADDVHLQQGDVRFEPLSALVADAGGLSDLRNIIEAAPAYLFDGGYLMLEHGWQQGEAVRELLAQNGYQQVHTWRDYGNLDRISQGLYRKPNSGEGGEKCHE